MKTTHRTECLPRGFLLGIVAAFAWCCLLAAQEGYTVKTVPNLRLSDRYNHVSNPDGIITPQDVAQINRILNGLEDSLSIEVAVVALNSIGDEDISVFAADLFREWGIGKKGEDNGLLILLVTGQRAVKFETGYGLEGTFPDAISARIQQRYMIPDFRENRFSAGMLSGVEALSAYFLNSDYRPREGNRGENGTSYFSTEGFRTLLYIYLALTFLVMVWFMRTISTIGKRHPEYGPVEVLHQSDNVFRQLGCITLVLFFPGIVLLAIWYFFYRQGLKRRTHICPNCGRTHYYPLPAKEGNALLDAQEQMENRLGSVKHTVYRCNDCHYTGKYAVDSPNSPYSRCPRCGTKSLISTGTRVIQQPTLRSDGLAEETFHCEMCNYTDHHKKVIDRSQRGALIGGLGGLGGGLLGGGRGFGGGFGGGGFGGGSWGGGMSGGGGSVGRF